MANGDDILNSFVKQGVAKDAFAVVYDKHSTLVDSAAAHDSFVCAQRSGAVGEAMGSKAKVGQFLADGNKNVGFFKNAGDSAKGALENSAKDVLEYGIVDVAQDAASDGMNGREDEAGESIDAGKEYGKKGFCTFKKAFQTPGNVRQAQAERLLKQAGKLEQKAEKFNARANFLKNKSDITEQHIKELASNKKGNLSPKDKKKIGKLSKKSKKLRKASARSRAKANRFSKDASKKGVKAVKKGVDGIIKAVGGGLKSLFTNLLPFLIPIVVGMVIAGLFATMFFLLFSAIGSNSSGSDKNLNEKEAYVYNYLKLRGYSDAAIAGVMGNIQQEQDWSPADTRYKGDDGGLGIFQMTDDRAQNMIAFCAANNIELLSIEAGLRFAIEGEIEGGSRGWQLNPPYNRRVRANWTGTGGWDGSVYGAISEKENGSNVYKGNLDEFKHATDVTKATISWALSYERCSEEYAGRFDKRVEYATGYLDKIRSGGLSNGSLLPANDGSAAGRAAAYLQSGAEYAWGACSPGMFDCSGFVSYCLTGEYGHKWTTNDYMGWAQVSREQAQPGDVCTNDHHCGLYIGNGEMIHMPGRGKGVRKVKVYDNMIIVRYNGGG